MEKQDRIGERRTGVWGEEIVEGERGCEDRVLVQMGRKRERRGAGVGG